MTIKLYRYMTMKRVIVYNFSSERYNLMGLALAWAVILYTFQTETCKFLRVWFVDEQEICTTSSGEQYIIISSAVVQDVSLYNSWTLNP